MRFYAAPLLIIILVLSVGASHGAQISLNIHEIPFSGVSCTDLSPSQIQNAYGFNSLYNMGINGNGQNVAIVVAQGDPTLSSDLAAFDSQYGLPSLVDGSNLILSYPFGDPSFNSKNWTVETALDVEVVHSLAPRANIYLVIAPNDSWLFNVVNYTIQNLPVQVISLSWGASEQYYSASQVNQINNILSAAQERHISIFAASGDSGAYNGLSTLNVNFPASSQYVIGVGGTSLSATSSGSYLSETAWSGSGGGYSAFFPKPAPQPNISSYRMVPDVSFNAGTPICAYISSAWGGYYGTSVAAPSWAAISALVDQRGGGSGVVSLKSLYSAFYSEGGIAYNLISSGNNGYYSANGGYSLVTGIGSPKVYALAQILTKASYKISFSALGAGAVFDINGINYSAPFSLNFSYGQKVSMGVYAPSHNMSKRYAFVSYRGFYNSTNRTAEFYVDSSGNVTANFKTQFAINEVNIGGNVNTTVYADNGTYFTASSQLNYILSGKSFSLVGIKIGENSLVYNSSLRFFVSSPTMVNFLWRIGSVSKFIISGVPQGARATVNYTNYVPLSNRTSTYTALVGNGESIPVIVGSKLNYSGQIYLSGYRYFLQPSSILSAPGIQLSFVKESRYVLTFVSADNSTLSPTEISVLSASANSTFSNDTIWVPISENFKVSSVELNNNGFNALNHNITLSQYNYSSPIKLPVSDVSVLVKLYLGIPVIGAAVKFSYDNLSIENSTSNLGSAQFSDVPNSGYSITIMAYGSNYTFSNVYGKNPSFQINPFMYQLYVAIAAISLVILIFSVWEELMHRKKKRSAQ